MHRTHEQRFKRERENVQCWLADQRRGSAFQQLGFERLSKLPAIMTELANEYNDLSLAQIPVTVENLAEEYLNEKVFPNQNLERYAGQYWRFRWAMARNIIAQTLFPVKWEATRLRRVPVAVQLGLSLYIGKKASGTWMSLAC